MLRAFLSVSQTKAIWHNGMKLILRYSVYFSINCNFTRYQRGRVVERGTVAHSICTHYSCFENMGWFVTLKKIRSKIWTWKKQVAKNRVIVIQKEKRQPGLFSFWITMILFYAPCFLHSIFCTLFLSFRP